MIDNLEENVWWDWAYSSQRCLCAWHVSGKVLRLFFLTSRIQWLWQDLKDIDACTKPSCGTLTLRLFEAGDISWKYASSRNGQSKQCSDMYCVVCYCMYLCMIANLLTNGFLHMKALSSSLWRRRKSETFVSLSRFSIYDLIVWGSLIWEVEFKRNALHSKPSSSTWKLSEVIDRWCRKLVVDTAERKRKTQSRLMFLREFPFCCSGARFWSLYHHHQLRLSGLLICEMSEDEM